MKLQNRLLHRYYELEGLVFDKALHYLLVIGNARCGMVKNSLYRYKAFLESDFKPDQEMLDILFQSICFSIERQTDLTNPFTGNNSTISDVIVFMLNEYKKFELIPCKELFQYLLNETVAKKVSIRTEALEKIKDVNKEYFYSLKPKTVSKVSKIKMQTRLLEAPYKNLMLTRHCHFHLLHKIY
jgi:hypothetical protein